MMTEVIKKIQETRERRIFLKKISFLLESGTYRFTRSNFCQIQDTHFKGLRHYLKTVRIKSKASHEFTYDHGRYYISPYKYIAIFEDRTYYLTKERNRYLGIKERLLAYGNRIPYHTIRLIFDDERQMMISDTISAKQYTDEKHFHKFILYCCESLRHAGVSVKTMPMGEQSRDIVFCVQHGDCNNRNILWDEHDNIILIDLDDIDEYPLFYDLFYYIQTVLHQDAFCFYQSKEFILQIRQVCELLNIAFGENTIDIYLAAYVYYHVNRMTRDTRHHHIHFYLKWFLTSDLSAFPITQQAIEEYRKKLEYHQIRSDSE